MTQSIKRLITQVHRLLGSLLSILFLMWFMTGIVLIFFSFPRKPQEKLFNDAQVFTSTDSVSEIPYESAIKGELSLFKRGIHLVYETRSSHMGKATLYDASTLEKINAFPDAELELISHQSYPTPIAQTVVINRLDQWLPWSQYKRYLPLHKHYLDDKASTVVYLSEKTGDILQVTTRKTRSAAWLGAIPHWLYFKSIRLDKPLWRALVITLSSLGILMCLSGILTSLFVIRRRRRRAIKGLSSINPYKKFYYKWHHLFGLGFGVFVFTFILSGLVSVTGISDWRTDHKAPLNHKKVWNDKALPIEEYSLSINKVLSEYALGEIKKVEWTSFDGHPYYFVYTDHYRRPSVIDAQVPHSINILHFTEARIKARLRKCFGKDCIANFTTVNEPDGYIAEGRHYQLPSHKVDFNNEDGTTAYIDLYTGKMAKVVYQHNRVERWLFRAIHSFKFGIFLKIEWLRKTVLILISLGGIVLSLSGVVLSVKYLRKQRRE